MSDPDEVKVTFNRAQWFENMMAARRSVSLCEQEIVSCRHADMPDLVEKWEERLERAKRHLAWLESRP
jgi:hypothetical protein